MAQKLFVKVKKPDGTTGLKAVSVLRSWQESDGRQIYLHANGVYGYKDGSPVQKKEELNIIGAANQRKLALAWWDRVGEKMSTAHYKRLQEAEEARQLEGLPAVDGESSDLDGMTYLRRPKAADGKKKKADWSEPATWPEYGFSGRPDWWGFADQISIAGFEYQIVEVKEEEEGNAEVGAGSAEGAESTVTIEDVAESF